MRYINGVEIIDNARVAVTTEILSGNKTLTTSDYIVQWLDPNGADRDLTLPAETSSTNLFFIILNTANATTENLIIKNDTPATIATLGPGQSGMFSCDGTDWKWENNTGIYYDEQGVISQVEGILQIINDTWFRGHNAAGTDFINLFKINTSDEIDVGTTINLGTIEAVEDSGAITFRDMPVSATPGAGTEESFADKIDGNVIIKIYAEADSSGGTQNEGLLIERRLFCTPSGDIAITAAGGITVTKAIMRVTGDGGAIDITANPQIVAGKDGQIVIIQGTSDVNTVTLDDGTGLALSAQCILANQDSITLMYDLGDTEWIETSRTTVT